jgi:hypothetical protein
VSSFAASRGIFENLITHTLSAPASYNKCTGRSLPLLLPTYSVIPVQGNGRKQLGYIHAPDIWRKCGSANGMCAYAEGQQQQAEEVGAATSQPQHAEHP